MRKKRSKKKPEWPLDCKTDPRSLKDMSVRELLVGNRASNCLRNEGIRTVSDLCKMTPIGLLKIKHMGRITVIEICFELNRNGLKLKEDSQSAWFTEQVEKLERHYAALKRK